CRANANRQLAFGSGVHACVGAPLARQEMISAFGAIIARMQHFTLDPSQPEPDNDPSFLLRGLNNLHMRFERR
ncbi:MAG: cytochrome P450, partial [Proteobacteria bacterium]|nr:cytochrome P450 [Pseudomonadota bacterium]